MNKKMSEQEFIEISEMVHEWRDIPEYEGLYRINEYGDVISIGHGKKRLLKPQSNGNGYLYVTLCKNGTKIHYYIHRLVATAFCDGAGEFEEVNHIDEIKSNNHYSNLEWCSKQYNLNYGVHNQNQRIAKSLVERQVVKVRCVELDIIFESTRGAARYVEGDSSAIRGCCQKKRKTHKGYHWEYVG